MSKKTINELTQFLKPEARDDVKLISLQYLAGVSCDKDGTALLQKRDIIAALSTLLCDKNCNSVHLNEVYKVLINASADMDTAWKLIHMDSPASVIPYLFTCINDKDYTFADHACKLVSNITHHERCCKVVIEQITEENINLEHIIRNFFNEKFNCKENNLHYFAPVISNITQSYQYRLLFLDKDKCLIQQLLSFIGYAKSVIRRGGIIGAIRNCCFETEYHSWLAGDEVDIVPRLLLPLAGGEEFDDDEMSQLADDLQYLPVDKEREPDEDIRKMLLEALTQLCATRVGRDKLRQNGAYYILREHHKWEKCSELTEANENLVEILIREEGDIGVDNLRSLDDGKSTEKN